MWLRQLVVSVVWNEETPVKREEQAFERERSGLNLSWGDREEGL